MRGMGAIGAGHRTTFRRALGLAAAAGLAVISLGPAPALALELPPTQPDVYVYDLANIWTPATEQRAQQIAEAIRTRTQAELAIVSWPTGFSTVDTDTAAADARQIID